MIWKSNLDVLEVNPLIKQNHDKNQSASKVFKNHLKKRTLSSNKELGRNRKKTSI